MGVGWTMKQIFPRHFHKGSRVHHPTHGFGTIVGQDANDSLTMLVDLDLTFTQIFPDGSSMTHREQRKIDILEPDGWRVISALELLAECAED